MKDYLKRTWKNKIVSVMLAAVGYASTLIENDGTAFLFLLMFAVPLFFAKKNYIK